MDLAGIGEEGIIRLMSMDNLVDPEEVVVGIGDDTAVLKGPQGELLLAATDLLVEGQHFLADTMPPRAVGHKALAVNASDIAAMGGQARHALISLALPEPYSRENLEALFDGLKSLARELGVNVVGGDTSVSPGPLFISVTILGQVDPSCLLLRSGAREGDHILVTGRLGGSQAGLEALLHPDLSLPGWARQEVVSRHQFPRPRLREMGALAQTGGVSAANDVSDGLAKDLREICQASGVGALVQAESIPLGPGAREVARALGQDPLEYALYGGEDFEVLLTAPGDRLDGLHRAAGEAGFELIPIGRVVGAAEGVRLHEGEGRFRCLEVGGWDPFGGVDP